MSFLLSLLFLILGISLGIPIFHQVLYPIMFVLPGFKKLQKMSKVEVPELPELLFVTLRMPLLWMFVLILLTITIGIFFLSQLLYYMLGLLIALITVMIELPQKEPTEEFISTQFGEDNTKPANKNKKGEVVKYPQYSALQMKMMHWELSTTNPEPFKDLLWICAYCENKSRFSRETVSLQGRGNRFIMRCERCGKHSIVRMIGVINCRLLTEARLPDYSNLDFLSL